MSSVYGNPYINIAASFAKDIYGGLFLKSKLFGDRIRVQIKIQKPFSKGENVLR